MKSILLIAYPYAASGANMLRYRSFANHLVKRGYDVDVIGYYELKGDSGDGIRYYKLKARFGIDFIYSFFVMFFTYTYLIRVQGLKAYVRRVGLASMTYAQAVKLLKRCNYEACLVGVLPWAYYLLIPFMKKYVRTVVDISDPLYKNAINDNSHHPANLRLEREALICADHVVTMNEPTVPIMTGEMGVPSEKISFISPAMNIDTVEIGLPKVFSHDIPLRVIYSGSLYAGYRDLSEIQPAVESMCGDVVLDVYSNSVYKPKETPNVHMHRVVEHGQILRLYQQYDVLLFVDNAYGYQVPSKIFELLAQNKPILFVYDTRNHYFRDMLDGQKGIHFVVNKEMQIEKTLRELTRSTHLEVHYNFDLQPYTEDMVNRSLEHAMLVR